MELIRVRLDWMDEGDYVTGLSDGSTWNGWESVWLDTPAIYALDRAAEDCDEFTGALFDIAPALAVEPGPDGLVFFDVQPNGERTPLPSQVIDGVKYYDFQGWCFLKPGHWT